MLAQRTWSISWATSNSIGLVDGENERCGQSTGIASPLTMVDLLDPLFKSWLCLVNTNQRCCWCGKPVELFGEDMFTASARRLTSASSSDFYWPALQWRTWDCAHAPFPPHGIHKATPLLGAAMTHTHAHAWMHRTPARAHYFFVRMAVNNRWNVNGPGGAFSSHFFVHLTYKHRLRHLPFIHLAPYFNCGAQARERAHSHTYTHTHTHIIHSNDTHACTTITSAHASQHCLETWVRGSQVHVVYFWCSGLPKFLAGAAFNLF